MITAKHNSFITTFFRYYVKMIIKRHFHTISISGDTPEPGHALLMIGNHFSWWDGFFAFYVNNTLLKKRFHVMMLEEQLAKRKFFRSIGVFSVSPGNRTVLDSLRYASRILENPENMLVIYPQGKIESSYIQKLKFGKGVVKILQGVSGSKPQILFYAALADYFSNRKPTLNIYLSPVTMPENFNKEEIEASYNDFYMSCINQQCQ